MKIKAMVLVAMFSGALCFAESTKDINVIFDDSVSAIAIQDDGKILVGGVFNHFSGNPCGNGLARLMPDGSLDREFARNTRGALKEAYVSSILIHPSGWIYTAGSFRLKHDNFQTIHGLARWDFSGQLDKGFLPETASIDGVVETMVLQKDDGILVGGDFSAFRGSKCRGLARVFEGGDLDLEFLKNVGSGIGEMGVVQSLAVQDDGAILIAGGFSQFQGEKAQGVVRLFSDGHVDKDFQQAGQAQFFTGFAIGGPAPEEIAQQEPFVPTVALQKDGGVVFGGEFVVYDRKRNVFATRIMRLQPGGEVDFEFVKEAVQMPFKAEVNVLAVQSDGKILVGCDNPFHRLLPNGTPDGDFFYAVGNAFSGQVETIVMYPDGRILLGGSFSSFQSVRVGNLARLNTDGSLDESFHRE